MKRKEPFFNCRSDDVVVYAGDRKVVDFAPGSRINIFGEMEYMPSKTGCDGTVERVAPISNGLTIEMEIVKNSDTASYFARQMYLDGSGDGVFRLIVNDVCGVSLLDATAWVIGLSPRRYTNTEVVTLTAV